MSRVLYGDEPIDDQSFTPIKESAAAPATGALTCERCNLPPAAHGGHHWCDNQSFVIASTQAEPSEVAPQATKDAEPTWIVNDLGELGVKVGERFFFLYKGDNIEYGVEGIGEAKDGIALHGDDGSQMMYRIVGKREFGEVQYPAKWLERGFSGDRYNEPLVFTPGMSYGEPSDGDWKPLPAIGAARISQGEAP